MAIISRKKCARCSKTNNSEMRLFDESIHNQNDFTDTGKSSKMANGGQTGWILWTKHSPRNRTRIIDRNSLKNNLYLPNTFAKSGFSILAKLSIQRVVFVSPRFTPCIPVRVVESKFSKKIEIAVARQSKATTMQNITRHFHRACIDPISRNGFVEAYTHSSGDITR